MRSCPLLATFRRRKIFGKAGRFFNARRPIFKCLYRRRDLHARAVVGGSGGGHDGSGCGHGARGYATPSGHFKVSWLDEHHESKQYNDAPMPYAIFFDEGKAIHGFARSVGGPASHGCVRLSTGNAKTLFRLVEQQQGLAGFKYDTTIIVR